MYYYHQKHGFNIMMLGQLLDLATFAFVVWFVTGLVYCVDYAKLDGYALSPLFSNLFQSRLVPVNIYACALESIRCDYCVYCVYYLNNMCLLFAFHFLRTEIPPE